MRRYSGVLWGSRLIRRLSDSNEWVAGDLSVLSVFQALTRSQQCTFLRLFAVGLFFWSSMASLLPTLPLYVRDVGGTQQQVGFVMGAFAIGLLLSRPTLGTWADRRSRTSVLRVGTAVVTLAPLGYFFVTSISSLMLLRAFHGISVAAFTTAYSALVADLSPPQQRGELIGYMTLVTPLGVAIGPALGGFVQADLGYSALFGMTATFGALSWWLARSVEEPKIDRADSPPSSKVSAENSTSASADLPFWKLLTSPSVRVPTFVMLVVGLIFGTITTFVPLYIEASSIDLNPGWFYTTAAVSSFSMRLFAGRASDRIGRGLFISSALVCYVLSMAILSQSDRSELFLLAAFLEGMGAGVLIPTTIALMTDRSKPQERGRIFSLCVGGFDLGIAIAGPLLGSVAQYLSYSSLFAIAMGLASIAFVLFVTANSKDLPHSLQFALGRGRDLYALDRLGNR